VFLFVIVVGLIVTLCTCTLLFWRLLFFPVNYYFVSIQDLLYLLLGGVFLFTGVKKIWEAKVQGVHIMVVPKVKTVFGQK
jgi:hypothetical protein